MGWISIARIYSLLCDPMGIYFGTRSGQLFGSRDEGRTWQKILEGLPSVVCVRNAVGMLLAVFGRHCLRWRYLQMKRNLCRKQEASTEAVIHAGHFSHSGGFARIYRWTQ
jgi:hypothetical protein